MLLLFTLLTRPLMDSSKRPKSCVDTRLSCPSVPPSFEPADGGIYIPHPPRESGFAQAREVADLPPDIVAEVPPTAGTAVAIALLRRIFHHPTAGSYPAPVSVPSIVPAAAGAGGPRLGRRRPALIVAAPRAVVLRAGFRRFEGFRRRSLSDDEELEERARARHQKTRTPPLGSEWAGISFSPAGSVCCIKQAPSALS